MSISGGLLPASYSFDYPIAHQADQQTDSPDAKSIVKMDCDDGTELELEREHLKKIPFIRSLLENLSDGHEQETAFSSKIPLPTNISKLQFIKAYYFAAREEIAENDIDTLMQQYSIASFLEFKAYEEALHAKILELSPMSLITLCDVDFGLFARSINKSFREKVSDIAKETLQRELLKKIKDETGKKALIGLLNTLFTCNNKFRTPLFENMDQFIALVGNAPKETCSSVKFVGFSFLPNEQEFVDILNELEKFPNIKEVKFPPGFITGLELQFLKKFKTITRLDLSECTNVTDFAMMNLREMRQLTHLSLSGLTNVSHEGFKCISSLARLKQLDISRMSHFEDHWLDDITELPKLTHLNLSGLNQISHDEVYLISGMRQLTYLDISNIGVVDNKDMRLISGLTNLTHLNLSGLRYITDSGFKYLSKMTNLTHLNISDMPLITDKGIMQLSVLTKLTHLHLGRLWKITNIGMSYLSRLIHLTHLNLSGVEAITDSELKHLSGLSKLTHLNLYFCWRIKNVGLSHLAKLTQLTHLNLAELTRITNEGISHLSGMKDLTYLNIAKLKKVTETGLTQLKFIKTVHVSRDPAKIDEANRFFDRWNGSSEWIASPR